MYILPEFGVDIERFAESLVMCNVFVLSHSQCRQQFLPKSFLFYLSMDPKHGVKFKSCTLLRQFCFKKTNQNRILSVSCSSSHEAKLKMFQTSRRSSNGQPIMRKLVSAKISVFPWYGALGVCSSCALRICFYSCFWTPIRS